MNSKAVGYKIKLDEGDMLVDLALVDGQLLRRAWGSEHHCHANYELHVMIKGESTINVEDVRHELRCGSVLLIEGGRYHKPVKASESFERFSMCFTLSTGVLLSRLKEAVPKSALLTQSKDFSWYLRRLIEESASQSPSKETAVEALVTLLSLSLLRMLGIVKYIEKNEPTREDLERTQKIDKFFERRFNERSGCASLAKELHMSTKQLNRVLKKHYGIGFQEKLIATRMERASLLLRTTSMRVQDVIEAVGYSSYETFYKAFVARFGVNPQKYRAAYKKDN